MANILTFKFESSGTPLSNGNTCEFEISHNLIGLYLQSKNQLFVVLNLSITSTDDSLLYFQKGKFIFELPESIRSIQDISPLVCADVAKKSGQEAKRYLAESLSIEFSDLAYVFSYDEIEIGKELHKEIEDSNDPAILFGSLDDFFGSDNCLN